MVRADAEGLEFDVDGFVCVEGSRFWCCVGSHFFLSGCPPEEFGKSSERQNIYLPGFPSSRHDIDFFPSLATLSSFWLIKHKKLHQCPLTNTRTDTIILIE